MTRREFVTGAAGTLAARAVASDPAKPNILFIAFDDLNQYINCLGWRHDVRTPNMDRLAARGVLFTNAHCAAPICHPSRTALMTGVRPSTSGVYNNPGKNELAGWRKSLALAHVTTLPAWFRQHGYRTAGGGKLFHALQWTKGSQNDPEAWDSYFPDMFEVIPPQVLAKDFSVEKSNQEGRPIPWFHWGPLEVGDAEMSDHKVVDWAISELRKPVGKPLFLGVGIFRPHMPWHVPQKYFDMYPMDKIELPPHLDGDLDDTHGHDRRHWHKWVMDHHQWKNVLQAYFASITYADAELGRLLDAFDASPYAKNTVALMWGDNGMHMGEKENWEKFTLWEESTRVPLAMVVPGVTKPGGRCARPVSLLDVYPTLMELAGGKPGPPLEGQTLAPLLRDPQAPRAEPAVTTWKRGNHAVRSERWRYIRYSDGYEELYDHQADPYEYKNLARDAKFDAVKAEHARWLPQVNAPEIGSAPRE